MKKQPLVYIIVLNFNGYDTTIECLQSIMKNNYSNYHIVLVDNCSTDNSRVELENWCKDRKIITIFSDRNLGYAGGNNLGIKYACKCNAEYVCIANNDLTVDNNFLTLQIEQMEKDDTIGISGPMVCDYTNPTKIQSTGAMINLYTCNSNFINRGKDKDQVFKQVVNCDYVSGSCILVRVSLLKEIGYIPEIYFMFYEETEWCLLTKSKGLRVVCVCNAIVYHKGSISVKKCSKLEYYYMNRNKIIFINRNGNKLNKSVFAIYTIMQMLYRLVTGNYKKNILNIFIDGIKNRDTFKFN